MHRSIPILGGLSALAPRYEMLLCDVWGVLHNGREAFPGVVDCLRRARAVGNLVLLLSNAPRPSEPIKRQLESLQVPRDAYDGVVTSGDLVQNVFAERTAGERELRVLHVGPDRDLSLFEGFPLVKRVAMDQAEAIVCTGPYDDTTEAPDDYRALWADARTANLPLICANPDILVQRGEQMIYCAGALAAVYEEMGGEVLYLGKPHLPVYDFVARRVRSLVGRDVAKSAWLAVGDGLRTDILGATRAGIDALLITGGIHEQELADANGMPNSLRIVEVLRRDDLKAVAAMRRLVW
jgi:HAD superfamily hydrolase (TIGR01459 family)